MSITSLGCGVFVLGWALVNTGSVGGLAEMSAETVAPPAPTVIEEPAGSLMPRRARSEEELDAVTAAAHFAYGRLLLRRGEEARALRRFQRAWRYDPDSQALLREIVSLAQQLGRPRETARYAVLVAERKADNPQLLTQLGAWLVEQGSVDRALGLFETALRLYQQRDQPERAFALQVEMGRLYLAVNKPTQAARLFERVAAALDTAPSSGLTAKKRERLITDQARLYALMAAAFLQAADYDRAQQFFRRAHRHRADEAKLSFNLARVAFAAGDWDTARSALARYFEARSSTAGTAPYELLKQTLGKTSSDAAQASSALLSELRALYDRDTDNAPLGYYFAKQLLEAQQWAAAEVIYLDLLGQRPAVPAFQGLAEIYYHQRKPHELLEIFADLLEKRGSTEDLTAQFDLVTQDEQLLAQLCEFVLQQAKHSPDALTQRMRLVAALMAVSAGQFERGEALYSKALEVDGLPQHDLMRRMGLAMFFAERPARAAELFQQAIDGAPGDEYLSAYYFYLAGALELAAQTDQAVRAAEKAASLNDSLRFQARPAWVLYHAGRYQQAEERYRQLIRQFDNQHDQELRNSLRDARLVLSNICVALDRLPAAEEWLQQVLDEFPEDVGALNDLGYLWVDQGKHLRRALSMVQRAVAAAPHNHAYRDSLGWAYFRLGRYPQAVHELEQAVDRDDPDGVILDHLGDAYLKSNQPRKAVAAWRRAVKAFDADRDSQTLEATRNKIKQYERGQAE